MSVFEEFLEYCNEDNKKLKKDIEIWLCDFFDLPNRDLKKIPLSKQEKEWIMNSLSEKNQIRILGYSLKQLLK